MLNMRSEEYHTEFYSHLSRVYEYSNLEYEHVPVSYRVHQAEYGIHIIVAASQEYVKRSTGYTHTHTDREEHPRHEYLYNT